MELKINRWGYTLILLFSILLTDCSGGAHSESKKSKIDIQATKIDSVSTSQNGQQSPEPFPMPEVPGNLQEPRERAMYVINHFWDKIPVADTTLYGSKEDRLEASFANFVFLVENFPVKDVSEAIIKPLEMTDGKLLAKFLYFYKHYLYDPNSPMLNEEYYIPVLEWGVKSAKIDYAERVRMKSFLDLAMKNRVGKPVTNFSFMSPDGQIHRLSDIKTPYTLLIFYSPTCEHCHQILEWIRQNKSAVTLAGTGKVSFLFVCAEDDREQWQKHLPELPEYAIVGYDENQVIRNNQLYDLKAMPTIYLLGEGNKLIFKDVRIEKALDYLLEATSGTNQN